MHKCYSKTCIIECVLFLVCASINLSLFYLNFKETFLNCTRNFLSLASVMRSMLQATSFFFLSYLNLSDSFDQSVVWYWFKEVERTGEKKIDWIISTNSLAPGWHLLHPDIARKRKHKKLQSKRRTQNATQSVFFF